MTCELQWIGVSQWWCEIGPSGQAAWIQAIGSVLAIGVAIAIPYWTKRNEREKERLDNRKIVMAAAANLDIALSYQSAVFDFSPAGDGDIEHEFTLEQARNFMFLRPRTQESLQGAIDKSHYFSVELCEKIVRLGIEAAAYERIIDEAARRTPNEDPDVFFSRVQNTKSSLSRRIREVRELLQPYLPSHD